MVIKSREFFYDLRCQEVWETIERMDFTRVNSVSLYQALRDSKKNVEAGFLQECDNAATSTANLKTWLDDAQKKKLARDIIGLCTRTVAAAYEGGNEMEILESFESAALQIRPVEHGTKSIKSLLQDALPILEARSTNWNLVTGLKTGISDLDKMTDGMHDGEFIVIGAPTSCGKTAMALGIAMHNALEGISSAFVSAEMLPVRLAIRALCSESRVNFKQISEQDIAKLMVNVGRISSSPFHIQSVNGYTIGQVRALARRLKQQHGIKLFAVENIQLLLGQGDNREQRIANVSAGLKGIALELGIVVMGLSQLNEDNKLRESRAIGHDADTVWVLENDGTWQAKEQPMILNVEKCRDGETGRIPLTLFKTFTRFEQQAKIRNEDQPGWQPDN